MAGIVMLETLGAIVCGLLWATVSLLSNDAYGVLASVWVLSLFMTWMRKHLK